MREQDELKTTWRAIDKEAAEEINALIKCGVDIQAKDEVRCVDCCGGAAGV